MVGFSHSIVEDPTKLFRRWPASPLFPALVNVRQRLCCPIILESTLKESTMKHMQKAIALFGLCLLVTASSVFGQSGPQTVVNIPFSFVVADKTLPAGEYVIRRNRRDSDTTWVIEAKGKGDRIVLLTTANRSTDTRDKSAVVFNRYDDVYFLTAFWTAGNNTGREIPASSRERTMDKTLAMKETLIVTERGR
jgi:hypothetical protein